MPSLIDLVQEGREVQRHSPWPRANVDASVWEFSASQLSQGRWSLLGLWAEPSIVHMAILDELDAGIAVISLDCPDRTYPSVGAHHPPALRLERAVNDLFGLSAEGSPDTRPWLDHNQWGVRIPLGDRIDAPSEARPYRFLPVEGDGLHQIAVGPVHAGIIEPGHFRFTASGETVVRLEQRLGYTHKGTEGLMAGASLERAVQLAGRVSGDSTVAYAYAFSRAAEAGLELAVPARLHAHLHRLQPGYAPGFRLLPFVLGALYTIAWFAVLVRVERSPERPAFVWATGVTVTPGSATSLTCPLGTSVTTSSGADPLRSTQLTTSTEPSGGLAGPSLASMVESGSPATAPPAASMALAAITIARRMVAPVKGFAAPWLPNP